VTARPRARTGLALIAASTGIALATAGLGVASSFADDTPEQIVNGSFADGTAPWWTTGNISASAATGQLCALIPGGTTNPWDVIIGQNDVPVIAGNSYTFSFNASSDVAGQAVRAIVQNPDTYATEVDKTVSPGTGLTTFSYSFTAQQDLSTSTKAQVAFQVGGGTSPWTLCLDDISLKGGEAPKPYAPNTGPRVRVNQVGYLPLGVKRATLVTDSTTAMPWQLLNASGTVVAKGTTIPKGTDASAGQNVQLIDFSAYRGSGGGFALQADGETSYAFSIKKDLYSQLRVDSKTFFYTQRSGIAILDSIAPGYARAAGHIGVSPNQGDTTVGCAAASAAVDNWSCDAAFRTDVTGGWYDAGDQGKYVVNGGIAVSQLLGEYERNQLARTGQRKALADGTLRVPETGNKVPDILDEARWELSFLLKMQVPANTTVTGLTDYAGMAFQKVHDAQWTGLPQDPASDPQLRELHRPSTAATLNLAAAAAQGARLFRPYDKAFARTLLTAATTAYAAAKAHPAVYAPGADGTGGGAYDDTNVTDEFYWAAAELYLTTGAKTYQSDVLASPLNTSADIFSTDGFSWQSVAPLGRMDLATVPNHLPGRDKVRASVLKAADTLLAAEATQGYGQPYVPASGHWAWGSNSQILNNLVVLGTAYDISGRTAYKNGVLDGFDYILGRNALNISYVTGFGTYYSQNQHTRIYANELRPTLPHPPAGSLAGGPDSDLQDPTAASLLKGCAAQFCYVDDIQSYSTNEVAINWNSALSWVSSFVADQRLG